MLRTQTDKEDAAMNVQNPIPEPLLPAFALLEPLANKLVRGRYKTIVGTKTDTNTIYREGVSRALFPTPISAKTEIFCYMSGI